MNSKQGMARMARDGLQQNRTNHPNHGDSKCTNVCLLVRFVRLLSAGDFEGCVDSPSGKNMKKREGFKTHVQKKMCDLFNSRVPKSNANI